MHERPLPLTIREVAAQSGLSEYTLRYYERIGLIRPIPRDDSSGHRRYPPETGAMLEALSCLRKSGLSIEDMRRFLELYAQGNLAAAEQGELFSAHLEKIKREIAQLQIRKQYIEGKAAYWGQ
jgi:DNA-binding transcriptional MerR regulator